MSNLFHFIFIRPFLEDIKKLTLTSMLALITGWLFLKVGMPAPYLMGSLFGVWAIGGMVKAVQPHLGIPRWVHIPVLLGLGVLIGANFNNQFFSLAYQWLPTVSAMLGVTAFVTFIGYQFLRHIRGYDRPMAFLCAIPGGQAEAIVIARELVDKDYVVALFHLVRVVIVFVSTPLLLSFIEGHEAVLHSNETLLAMPSLFDLELNTLLIFVALGVSGYGFARGLRLPIPHLLGPMIVSLVGHAMGWVDLPRLGEFVILAQLTIGGAVGAKLAQVAVSELLGYLRDAIINACLIITIYLGAAIGIAALFDADFLSMWLAFVPGGLYEVTLLALIFGFDVAFVAFHHAVRILLIFFSLPVLVSCFRTPKK